MRRGGIQGPYFEADAPEILECAPESGHFGDAERMVPVMVVVWKVNVEAILGFKP